MRGESRKRPAEGGKANRILTRRDLLKIGFTGAILSFLNRGCEKKSAPEPPGQSKGVYELTDGKSMYDDFDGNGSFQTYNQQNLAEPGKLSSRLWQPMSGAEVTQNPADRDLLTVVNEEGQRVEYRAEQGPQEGVSVGRADKQEVETVYDADGNIIRAVPHIPGRPYHASRRLYWVGSKDGRLESGGGSRVIHKGRVYGTAETAPAAGAGRVLRMSYGLPGLLVCLLDNPREIGPADFGVFSADVMISSASTARYFHAALSYHTTIPEQPPGKSWFTELGISKYPSGEVYLYAQCVNVNTGYRVFNHLGRAQLDKWYNLRLEILTQAQDPTLKDTEFRIQYYVDGVLKETEIPEDSELLLDPARTEYGPTRFLIIYAEEAEGESVAFFDNVRAVYKNRLS
jgi:hypothetical protein